jgi:hypothetical protein
MVACGGADIEIKLAIDLVALHPPSRRAKIGADDLHHKQGQSQQGQIREHRRIHANAYKPQKRRKKVMDQIGFDPSVERFFRSREN